MKAWMMVGIASVVALVHTPTYAQSSAAEIGPGLGDTAAIRQEISKLREEMQALMHALGTLPSSSGSTLPRQDPSAMGMGSMAGGSGRGPMSSGQSEPVSAGMEAGSGMGPGAGHMTMAGMPMMRMMCAPGGEMGMMAMASMGEMDSSAGMRMASSLPGFPGQSHLYHVGATGFFLDHLEHITLTMDQQRKLADLKEQSVRQRNESQRMIEAAEERLWSLTGADQPEIREIEKFVREIERLRADQRLAFIRSVGAAAAVLSEQQRRELLGTEPTATAGGSHH